MKIYTIIIFHKENQDINTYKEVYDISNIPFFYRSTTKDLLRFLSKTVAEKTQTKLCVTEKEYIIYSNKSNNKIIIIITDKDYPSRVAFSMSDYIFQNDNIDLDKTIEKYQNPNEADQILKIQKSIDDTKFIMVDAIDKVLTRGEKIDDMIAKSSELSDESKLFYKDAKKLNSWCGGCSIQ